MRRSLFVIFMVLLPLGSVRAEPLRSVMQRVHTVDELVEWLGAHLRYRNVNEWDDAPRIEDILRNGYGDCKMLAGVTAVLLSHVKVRNWIVTIRPNKYYHMFNVYEDAGGVFRIINNARPAEGTFADWPAVLAHYGVTAFVDRHTSYRAFRRWFNHLYWEVKRRWHDDAASQTTQ